MKTIKATVAAQQKTLEDLQHDKRVKNLVITGVPEPQGDNSDGRKEDQSTIEAIFAAVDCTAVKPHQIKRLGVKRNPLSPNNGEEAGHNQTTPPARPLLVTLSTAADARRVLNKRHALKNNATFAKVYVKKDEHPLVRKEWSRLRAVARKEKAAPINVGCMIKLDYQKKAVTRDDVIIQEFVSPFRLQDPSTSA